MAGQIREIDPQQLAEELEAGTDLQILDVRTPESVASGRIDLPRGNRFMNIVGSTVLASGTLDAAGIDRGSPVVVVCSYGNDSRRVAGHLVRLGCDARSLAGGMAAWMSVFIPRNLPLTRSLDRLVQFDRVGKGSLGYVLISAGQALVIDAPRDPRAYLRCIQVSGARIVAVADTHVHADYISGGRFLSRTLGIPYYLHPADAVFPYDGTKGHMEFRPVTDGSPIPFGRCTVTAMHTPGHTEGSVTYLLDGEAAFTGDFLFIDSIGRPDLAGKTEEWAKLLWKSIERTRAQLDPGLAVYPAHYSSDQERRADRTVGASLRDLLRRNGGLQPKDLDSFLSWIESRIAPFPEAYRKIKAINVGLLEVGEDEALELESGKHECGLGSGPTLPEIICP